MNRYPCNSGYVSDMHKKDWKICWPFSDIMDNGHKSNEPIPLVPSVFDPSFDAYQGKIHWQETSDKAADQGFLFDSCQNLGKISNSSPNASKQDVISGRTIMADNVSNSSCDQKEKTLNVADRSDNCTGRFFPFLPPSIFFFFWHIFVVYTHHETDSKAIN